MEKERIENDDAAVHTRLPILKKVRTAAESVLFFLENSESATSDDVDLSTIIATSYLCNK